MDVLIVAAPKEVVESRIKACEAAGLDVEAVDVEPFATFRSHEIPCCKCAPAFH